MLARLFAFVIWGLVAATAVFWGLRLIVRSPTAPAYALAVGDTAAVRGDLTRLLGTAPVAPVAPPPEAVSRFRLLGIVAPENAGAAGVALIAVDGKLPKAYAVGAALDGDLVLQSVSLRSASIGAGPGARTITLELPRAAPAATGTPTSSMGGMPAMPGLPVPQYNAPSPPVSALPLQAVPTQVQPPPPGSAPVPLHGDSAAPIQ